MAAGSGRIGVGVVGAGLVGPQHIEALRRLGTVDVVAVAASSAQSAAARAAELGVRKAYGDYGELIADPDVAVVHNCTPNYLHLPVNTAILAAGKHVVSDKPLGMSAGEARQLLELARRRGVVHAVTFNYRGNPLVQHARAVIARHELGAPHFVHGHYLQDWLLYPSDFSWRIEPEKAGPSSAVGDIGSHWCDLAQHLSGRRITHVLADLTTVVKTRQRPTATRQTFAAARAGEHTEDYAVEVEDLGSVLLRFDGGCKGTFTVGQVCAGHKNDLVIEVNGSHGSLRWTQERQNELWIGRREGGNLALDKDPGAMAEDVQRYAHLPAGHQEGWSSAFTNVLRDIYEFIAAGHDPAGPHPPAFATFEDGYRANCVVDAILQSSTAGGVWTAVEDGGAGAGRPREATGGAEEPR